MVIIIIIIIIMSVFWSAFPCEICSIALNRCKSKNTEHLHVRPCKQHVSKHSCSNIQLSSKVGATPGVTVSTSAFLACHQC